MFFPLQLIAIRRFNFCTLFGTLASMLLASLLYAEFTLKRDISAAFFLLPSRAWELIVSAIAALISFARWDKQISTQIKDGLALAGFVAVAFSIFYFDKHSLFPSAAAFVPTRGCTLILLLARPDFGVGKLLATKPLLQMGLISYSAYLWHQPILVFLRLLLGESLLVVATTSAIIATFVLAWITTRFVEAPFRDRAKISSRQVCPLSIGGCSLMIGIGLIGHLSGGLPQRSDVFARLKANVGLSAECNGNRSLIPQCMSGQTIDTAIFGNSFAMHLVPAFQSAFPQRAFVQLTQDSCAPHDLDQRFANTKRSCAEFFAAAMYTIATSPQIKSVLISSTFGDVLEPDDFLALERTIMRIKSSGKVIVIVGPPPSTGRDLGRCFATHRFTQTYKDCNFDFSSITAVHSEINRSLLGLAAKTGAIFIDLTPFICPGLQECFAYLNEKFVYRDESHLSVEGSKSVFEALKRTGAFPALRD